MYRKLWSAAALAVLVIGLIGAPTLASGTTRWVNDDKPAVTAPGTSCDRPGYNKIQDAVNAASAGDTINVCPGTYPEEVVVDTAAKSNLKIRSTVALGARIQAPAVMDPIYGDIVRIDNGARNVTLQGFVVAGPLPDTLFCSASTRSGVRVRGNSSANILANRVTEIRSASPALRGCQNGLAVAVGRTFEFPTPNQVGQAVIVGNLIDKYQKGGIYVDNVGSTGFIADNVVAGPGQNTLIAPNGIQISRGAVATVRENWVTDNAYITPPHLTDFTAAGILLYQTGSGTVVDSNQLRRNQDGIDLLTTDHNTVAHNKVLGNLPPFNPALGTQTFGDGIFADTDTSNNHISRNFMRDNVQFDCEDDSSGTYNPPALVANPWVKDGGITQNKAGLCTAHGDEDDHGHEGHDRDHGGATRFHLSAMG